MTLGCSGAEAARRAGYSENSARFQAANLLHNPKIQEAIRKEQVKLIGGTLASKALRTLEQVMDEQPYRCACRCCKDYSGSCWFVGSANLSRESITPPTGRKISDLNADELVALINNAKTLIEKQIKTIEHVYNPHLETKNKGQKICLRFTYYVV